MTFPSDRAGQPPDDPTWMILNLNAAVPIKDACAILGSMRV